MDKIAHEVFTEISKLFTSTLFKVGDTPVSLWLILELILSLLVVAFVSGVISNFFKHRLLVKLGIDEGNREAIAGIVRYLTVAVGLIVVLQNIGFNFASLAVLAGGLGIGIGFGTQDLTTNFVSGLTLLLDRPIKVGDYVELDGGLMGIVKEISMRSTIIKTYQESCVIVPNRDMVDSRIINWSYDSSTYCLQIPVEVAEDSDPLLVTETLLNTAYIESAVLYEPNPKVLFVEFNEDGFKFELWVWIEYPQERDLIKSSLNFAIEYHLRQQGIQLAAKANKLWFRNPEVLAPLLHKDKPATDKDEPSQVAKQSPKQLSISDLLRRVKYFANFNDLELRQLIEAGYRQRLQADQILFRENDPGDTFYIIISGSVEVFVEKINKHLTTLHAGDFFGELSLMLGIPRTASVRALEDTVLFAINKKGFQKLLSALPQLYEQIIQELAKHQEELAQRQERLRELGLLDAAEDDQNPVVWVRKRLKNLFSI